MDSDKKKELNDDKEQSEDESTPVLEESSEKISETHLKPSAPKRSADPRSACGGSPRKISPTSEFPETAFPLDTPSASNIPSPGKYTSLIQRLKQPPLNEANTGENSSSAASSHSNIFDSNLLEASTSARTFRIQDADPRGACGRSPRKISPTSEFPETAFSLDTPSASNIPSPGKYTALIQRLKQPNLKEANKDENSSAASSQRSIFDSNFLDSSSSANTFRIPDREPTLAQRQRELGVKEDNSVHQQLVDRPIGTSRAALLQSSSMASGMLETSRTSDPLVLSRPESLIQRYREFNLMDSTEQVRDRPAESSSSASSRNNSVSSALFEASLRATEGVAGLPGPFASFLQRRRDFDEREDNSDEENIEPRPVFLPNLRWPSDPRTLNRGFRSGSQSACSEESTSRSASEASQSSGLQENREASASDSPVQQQRRDLNPPNDEATDEDEGDLESEEQSQDSDSERKGYSL